MKEAENWDKKWGEGVAVVVTGYRKAFQKRKSGGGGGCDWVTLLPSAFSSWAPSSAAAQVAGGRPTSADFSPFRLPLFPFLYLLPALFIPHRPPHCSISWCSGALTVPALSLPRAITLFNALPFDLIWKVGGAAGHRHWRWVTRGPFQFFIGVIWPSSLTREGRGCFLDFLEDR